MHLIYGSNLTYIYERNASLNPINFSWTKKLSSFVNAFNLGKLLVNKTINLKKKYSKLRLDSGPVKNEPGPQYVK